MTIYIVIGYDKFYQEVLYIKAFNSFEEAYKHLASLSEKYEHEEDFYASEETCSFKYNNQIIYKIIKEKI